MNQVLKKLDGAELAGITFIRNYLQLLFDGTYLNAYVWPVVSIDDVKFHLETPGYRDALCQQINKTVIKTVEVPNKKIALLFSNNCEMEFSLRDEDRSGPEAIMIQADSGNLWDIW